MTDSLTTGVTGNMEMLAVLFPIAVGGLIVPIVQWIKKILPTDFPLQAPMIVSLLSIGMVLLLAKFFAPDMPTQELVTYALGSQVLSQYIHGAKKTLNGGKS